MIRCISIDRPAVPPAALPAAFPVGRRAVRAARMRLSRRMWPLLPLLLASLCGLLAAPARAAGPHAHGAAHMRVAIDGAQVAVELEIPLGDVFGVERMPATPAERRRADAAMKKLARAEDILRLPPAAQCRVEALESNYLPQAVTSAKGAAAPAHADLELSLSLHCAQPAALTRLEASLFDAVPALQRIEVEVASGKRQAGATLTRQRRGLSW